MPGVVLINEGTEFQDEFQTLLTQQLQVMPLAMRNLAIAQEGDKNGFRLVQGGAYDRPKAKFQLGEYFLLIKNKNININKKRSLQPSVHLHILRNMEVRVPEWLYLVEMEQQ